MEGVGLQLEGVETSTWNYCLFRMQSSFHGYDISSLRTEALKEYFKQPIKDTFDVRIVKAKPVGHMTDFLKTEESELEK